MEKKIIFVLFVLILPFLVYSRINFKITNGVLKSFVTGFPFLFGYIILLLQSDRANFGIYSFIYIAQYFISFYILSSFLDKKNVALFLSILNGLILALLPFLPTVDGLFSWDFLVSIPILLLYIGNFVIFLIIFLTTALIRR